MAACPQPSALPGLSQACFQRSTSHRISPMNLSHRHPRHICSTTCTAIPQHDWLQLLEGIKRLQPCQLRYCSDTCAPDQFQLMWQGTTGKEHYSMLSCSQEKTEHPVQPHHTHTPNLHTGPIGLGPEVMCSVPVLPPPVLWEHPVHDPRC